MFIERIQKHLADGFVGDDWKITDNEILLYVDTAIPSVLKGIMFEMSKITGVLDVPEAFLVNYQYTLASQDTSTKEWFVVLDQTPLELPTGYDVTNVFLTDPSYGRSQNAYPIKTKRVGYRNYMPKPSGFSFRLTGQRMYLQSADGTPLLNYTLNVEMPVSRTSDVTAPMNLPDGALEPLFQKTVALIMQRYQIPQDIVKDDLPPGNKTS